MPNTKQVKRKIMETEQDKKLRELKKQRLEETLQTANNQKEALEILKELLFLTNEKKYSHKMNAVYGFNSFNEIQETEKEKEPCCSKSLTNEVETQKDGEPWPMNDKERKTYEEYNKQKQKQKNIIEISDEEDEEMLEGCCDNQTKTDKCITQELDTSVR